MSENIDINIYLKLNWEFGTDASHPARVLTNRKWVTASMFR